MSRATDDSPLSYKDAGVDIAAADDFVKRIGSLAQSTHDQVQVINKTAYAGLVRAPIEGMANPLIAATCDGVGTKLLVARDANNYSGLGQDLVAMNVNDLLPAAAKPLLFLDYLATGKLNTDQLETIVGSVARACRESGCALVGGETAEMPGLYRPDEFDLAGFAVGIVDQARVPDPTSMQAGDIVLGLRSTGVHSNGFSLARKALFDRGGLSIHDTPPELGASVADALLAPTALYVKPVLELLNHVQMRAAAHITGGGLLGRATKLLQAGLNMKLDPDTYERPPIFELIQKCGNISDQEMASTFNMGLGFLVVLSPEAADKALTQFPQTWLKVGTIEHGDQQVDLGYAGS